MIIKINACWNTIASASSGHKIIGRSFKYHRPRGIYSCGTEESSLFNVGLNNKRIANVKSTITEPHPNMQYILKIVGQVLSLI